MLKKIIILFSLLLCLSVFATTHSSKKIEKTNSITVCLKHPDFTITLPANPTTGFSWHIQKYSKNMFEFISEKYIASKNKKLMGAPGTQTFHFKAKKENYAVAQVSHIVFLYERSWEKKHVTKKTFIIVVRSQC